MAHATYKNSKGEKVDSVTTIISGQLGWSTQALLAWQVKMFKEGKDPTDIKNKAADIGTLVHEYIEAYIYGCEVSEKVLSKYSTDAIVIAETGLEQFKRKIEKEKIKFLETEMPLVSDEHNFGGCLDFIYTRPGIKCGLGDNKTSKAVYGNYIVQLGGYDILLNEKTKYRPEESLIVKINKDISKPEDEIVTLKYIDIDYVKYGANVFFGLLKQSKYKKLFDKYLETLN